MLLSSTQGILHQLDALPAPGTAPVSRASSSGRGVARRIQSTGTGAAVTAKEESRQRIWSNL